MNANPITTRLEEHKSAALEKYPKDWFVICLQGSQNYGISDKNSDIDSKLLILPSVEDLVFNKKVVSNTYIMENDEHCDVKDVREYFKIFRKQNTNFLEILFTDYFIVNPAYTDLWCDLLNRREDIAHYNPGRAAKCIYGMALEKQHALCHPYPSRMEWIDEYGYDPKQLSHIMRMEIMLDRYISGDTYEKCLDMRDHPELIEMKRGEAGISKQGALDTASNIVEAMNKKTNEYCDIVGFEGRSEADEILDETLYKLVCRSLGINNE